MPKIKKSTYIRLSRTLIRKLFDETCFGKGSLYLETLQKAIPKEDVVFVEHILESLVKQKICGKKKKNKGWKYFLHMERLDKIKQILKENGESSLFLLFM